MFALILKMTRNGIVYNLATSPFTIVVDETEYFFSSRLHMDKFTKQLHENRGVFSYKFTNKYNIVIRLTNIADMLLYNKIETRGFYIIHNGEVYSCKKEVLFDGDHLTKKN